MKLVLISLGVCFVSMGFVMVMALLAAAAKPTPKFEAMRQTTEAEHHHEELELVA